MINRDFMKYSPSFDGTPRADFRIEIRLSKNEVERLRRYLKKKNKRSLDIDVRRLVYEMGSVMATEDLIDFSERIDD